MNTLRNSWSTIVGAFHGHTLGCLEMQAVVIGWCLLMVGLIAHTVYGHLTKGKKNAKVASKSSTYRRIV